MVTIKEFIQVALHHISNAPGYYYNHFFCPVKRESIMLGFSGLAISFSYGLHKLSEYIAEINLIWSFVAKLLSGLILVMNFIMVFMALAKRVRDWKKNEEQEGWDEFKKRNR